MTERRMASILDVDGTACNVTPIRHYVTGGNRNFDAFHKASAYCEPHYDILEEVIDAHERGLSIVVFTGRIATYRNLTDIWLRTWEFPFEELHTRKLGDFRKDVEVKDDMWREASERYEFVKAWDDNPTIIKLWGSKGIDVRVKPGWDE